MRKLSINELFLLIAGIGLFLACKKDEPSEPPKVGIFFSIADKQVAFTSLTKRVASWNWDFGDGKSSTEANPVHVYESGGYYTVTLSGTGENGDVISVKADLAVALTPYVLLTGGPTAANGKTWKLTSNHPVQDKLANADATFTIAKGAPATLPPGAFGLYLSMPEVYEDTYTFYFDGRYAHDVKADKASFAGLLNQMMTGAAANIVNQGGKSFGLCTAKYTPQSGATFTYVEKENFAVPSVYGPGGNLTYENVSTLNFSGTEFIGLMDKQRKVILQDISDKSMRVVMFMAASQTYYPLNTHALVLTFEVVK